MEDLIQTRMFVNQTGPEKPEYRDWNLKIRTGLINHFNNWTGPGWKIQHMDRTELRQPDEYQQLDRTGPDQESVLAAQESILVPKEPIIVARESILVPQESTLVAQESILVPQESILVPKGSILVAQETILVAHAQESILVAQDLILVP